MNRTKPKPTLLNTSNPDSLHSNLLLQNNVLLLARLSDAQLSALLKALGLSNSTDRKQ